MTMTDPSHDLKPARAEERLRQSEERFRLMVEAVKDYAIFMLDPEGRITTWNKGAQRIKGYSEQEIVGEHFSRFYPPEEIARGKPAWELERAKRDGRMEDEGWRVRKDGSRFWANVIITALRNDEGRLVGYVKVTRDMTAFRAAAAKQEELIAALRRSNAELQDFAMVASHDLQEPLRKIQMFGERIRTQFGEQLPSKAQDFLGRMEAAAARGQSLILGLLAYSRVTSKCQPFEPIDVGKIMREVSSDLESQLAQVGGRIEIGPLPTLEGDPLQLRQLLQNLVGNALKFHKPDEPPVVRVSAQRLPATDAPGAEPGSALWELRVEDNGIGFDEKYAERIFRLFQRLHERGVFEGSGVGLAIVKKIVERHRGSVEVQSTLGQGTTFTIRLPEKQPRQEIEQQ